MDIISIRKNYRSFAEEINEVFNELSDTYRVSDINGHLEHSRRINILRNHPGVFSYCII